MGTFTILFCAVCMHVVMLTNTKPVDDYLKVLLQSRDVKSTLQNVKKNLHKLMGTRFYNGKKFTKPNINKEMAQEKRFELEMLPPLALNPGIKRASYWTDAKMWTGNTIKFGINSAFSASDRFILETYIQEFSDSTCVKWIQDPSAMQVEFITENTGCWSYVGDVTEFFTSGVQPLNLQINTEGTCLVKEIVHHEMMHVLGYPHEQSRSDRDDFVTINSENIRSGLENNFAKDPTENVFRYDYSSVMHYGLFNSLTLRVKRSTSRESMMFLTAEAKILFKYKDFTNGNGPTISVNEADQAFLVNSLDRMSFYDYQDILRKYQCTADCVSPPTCLNGGYLDAICNCNCPELFTGSTCETPVAHGAGCGNTQITVTAGSSVELTSPNYDGTSTMAGGFTCTYRVTGDANKKVKMLVKNMNLARNTNDCIHCLEIRRGLPAQKGIRICGQSTDLEFVTYAPGNLNVMNVVLDAEAIATSTGFLATLSVLSEFGETCAIDDECRVTQSCIDEVCSCPSNAPLWNSDLNQCEAFYSTFESVSDATKYFNYGGSEWQESVTSSGGRRSSAFGPANEGGDAFTVFRSRTFSSDSSITSTFSFPAGDYCLSFLANVQGSSSSLAVLTVTNGENLEQNIGATSVWQSFSLDLNVATDFMLRFLAQRCRRCIYGLDNVMLQPGTC